MKIPVLKLGDILLAPIPEDLGDEDALEFSSHILEKVNQHEAKGVVIDITALDVVDSFMARVINDTAGMIKLIGAEVVLCGMNPFVVLTLMQMGRELIGVRTALNLEEGVSLLRRIIAETL